MNIFFRKADPEGDLGGTKSAVKAGAKRRPEGGSLDSTQELTTIPEGWPEKRWECK